MNQKEVLSALKILRDQTKDRKFTQSIDLTVNFKGLDFRKPEAKIEADVTFPTPLATKKVLKSVAFVKDKAFANQLNEIVDRVVLERDIEAISKKETEQLALDYDVLVAEGPVMLTVGKFLGQILAPKGKMPKPVPMNVDIVKKIISRSVTSTKITNKKGKNLPMLHTKIGDEKFSDDDLIGNVLAVYNAIEEKLPGKKYNVKSVFIKATMGPPVFIGKTREGVKK